MTIVIYLNEDKTAYRVIHPKTWAENPKDNFDGNVGRLVEHITHSDFSNGVRNFYKYEVIND